MLSWVVTNALRQRVLVLAIAFVLVLLGVRATQGVPLDVFPEFAPPMVEIQTEAPGLSTEEVENLVTVPLENASERCAGSQDASLEVGPRTFLGSPDLQGRDRPDPCPPAGSGAGCERRSGFAGECRHANHASSRSPPPAAR